MISAAAASTSKQPKIPSLTKFLFQNFAKTSSKVQQSQELSALAKETATKKLQQAIFQGITKQFDQTVKKMSSGRCQADSYLDAFLNTKLNISNNINNLKEAILISKNHINQGY